ncbi:GntR family transcriptional regulator [Cohnella silvisoli]|uniref:Substrate-binding domain-containing protein n=1 Tax=Cohnella silvisoli TaxID=2873699 RepID=A0ABV1KUI1_9BACL|nr:substrate-binding domain-containing protein [Cohnella silvisoli]MCD9021544.1 substrate-binding domain-containing protein [Cohnella silvisoli]
MKKERLRLPLYIQIQEYFKKLISSGELTENQKIPTENELISKFNVSRITVANALTQLAQDGWIYRIPGRGSFVSKGPSFPETLRETVEIPVDPVVIPSDGEDISKQAGDSTRFVAQSSGKRMIALIIPTVEDFFALRLLKGINKILKNSDYYLAVILTNHSKEMEKEAIVQLLQKGVAGLIIFPIDAETYNDEILSLKINNFPFVLIDRYLPGVDTHFVCSNNRLGAQLAVSHLWELGHREIAICTDSPLNTVTVEERIAGYMDALKQREAMINPALILTEFSVDYKEKDDNHVLHRYIKNGLATAYITLNAQLGLYIAGIARRLKLNVPGRLSILTFDDPSSGIDEQGTFTHIAQSEDEIGSRAASILIDLLNNPENANGYKKVILKPELVIRSSTGPLIGLAK